MMLLMVTKMDRSMRFTVDYRQFNDCTKKDSYAMPDPQSILDRMCGDKYLWMPPQRSDRSE